MGEDHKPTFLENVRNNWTAFRLFLWNSERREFLGRNSKSWGQIGLFYLVYYIFLALFWALMMFIFLQTVDSEHPTFNSYVGVPGLTLVPKFDNQDVTFNPDVPKSYKDHVDALNKIWNDLDPSNQTGSEFVDCTNDTAPEGKFCRFDREAFGPCQPPNFGWDEGSPCLLLSLNRVSGWEPEDYEEGSVPEEIADVYTPGNIAFRCMNYKNKHTYSNSTVYPRAGIPFEYYPYVGSTNETKRAGYIQPYVAVQFDFNTEDVVIKVQCMTYCGNIAPMGAQVGFFYLVYYIFLAGFWGLMFYIFWQTIDMERPSYSSYVGRPGLKASPHSGDNVLQFSTANNNDYAKYVEQLQEIWDSLAPENQTEGYVDCENGTGPPEGKYCRFDRTLLGEFCIPPDFGFDQGKPCAFISLNQVYDWVPEDYKEGEVPEEVAESYKPGYISFKCGSYKNKKPEQLGEGTRIYPYSGIPYHFYPFPGTTNVTKRAAYQKPYVAVRFDILAKEEDVKVQCQTFTGSIEPLKGMYDTKFESIVVFTIHLTKEPVNLEL